MQNIRIKIIRLIVAALLLIVALDLVYVQAIRGNYFHALSVNNRIRVMPLDASRGVITDREGEILADNRLAFNVSVIPQDIKDKDELFRYLAEVLKTEPLTLSRRFYERKITPFAPVVVADDVDLAVAMALEENRFRFPGLYIQETFIRRYPFKDVGSHVLGYVGKINRSRIERLKDYGYTPQSVVGYSGVEEYYDSFLQGKPGGDQIEVNSRGQQVRLLSTRDPQNGRDIQLTIDRRIQAAAAEVLTDKPGALVVLDLDSGEVLGMVSSPSYDPNIFVSEKMNSRVRRVMTDPDSPLLNRVIKGQYPPGSVFKVVVSIAVMISDKITPYTTFFCNGGYNLGRRRFRCAHQHGNQNLIEAIAHSCNVYFYNAGLALGPEMLNKFGVLMGLGQVTQVDLPFEEKGNVPGPLQRRRRNNSGWHKGDTLNFSIGQGDVLATPIQVARLLATVARKGREVEPHLIKAIDGEEIIKSSAVRQSGISEEVFDVLKLGLRSAVSDSTGTARILNLPGVKISGKTGTAQSVPGRKEHAWFAGFTSERQRNIAFVVFLEYGGSSYNACVVTKKFFDLLLDQGIL